MKDELGKTPLHSASSFGQIDAVKALLELGADINAQDNRGNTPLHWAVLSPLVWEKFSTGDVIGDEDAETIKIRYETELCSRYENAGKLCEVLLQNGADPSLKNSYGRSSSYLAMCLKPHNRCANFPDMCLSKEKESPLLTLDEIDVLYRLRGFLQLVTFTGAGMIVP